MRPNHLLQFRAELCCLGSSPVSNLHQKISEFPSDRKALIAKNNQRAFAILKQLAAMQVVSSPDLENYPALQKAIENARRKHKSY